MSLKAATTAVLAMLCLTTLTACSEQYPGQLEPMTSGIQLRPSTATSYAESSTSSPAASPSTSSSPAASPSGTGTGSGSPSETSSPSASSSEDGESEDGTTPISAVFDKNAEIEISDQSGDGKSIVIKEVEVSIDNLWLVISTSSGLTLATVMTTTQFKPVTVSLFRTVTSSQKLIARLYRDDGDGLFERLQDAPVFEEPGELVEEDFFLEID